MKKKEFLTEAKRKAIISEKEKAIIESFAKTFNKIKRIDENELNEYGDEDYETQSRMQQHGTNPEIEPDDLNKPEYKNFVPDEIFELETYDFDEFYELNFDGYDSKAIMRFFPYETENENDCLFLVAEVNFSFKVSGSYRAQTLYEPEEYPELEFEGSEDVVDVYYLDCKTKSKRYELTDEMLKKAYPNIIKNFENQYNYIEEKGYEKMNDNFDEPDDYYYDRDDIDEDMVQEGSDTYFETLSEALDAVRQKVEQLGFEVDEDAMFTQFGTGGIPYETEKSANIPLLMNGEPILDKRGREANRYIRVSIYRMSSGRYELTMYKTW